MNYDKESLDLHKKHQGKIRIAAKMDVHSTHDLSLVYSPGVAAPCKEIAADEEKVWDYTIKGNCVAIVTDGSAVLGLGNIGAKATEKIIETVKLMAPVFGGVNLEDISAPRCLEIEERLQDIGIPVFHDDQHGTAIVVLAGLINACKVAEKKLEDVKVVINGAGAAGIAIAKLLRCVDNVNEEACIPVKEIIVCDSKGIISQERDNLNDAKKKLLTFTNPNNINGKLQDAIKDADVFIGVSIANLLTAEDISTMADKSIVFALANPVPEIMPEEAYKGGALVVGTGRSDMPNQVNNVLGFPGIFRGALDARAKRITPKMKLAAAYAIAECIKYPNPNEVIPATLNMRVASQVAEAVKKAAQEENA